MANIKISDLTAAASAADANEFEINEAGTSKKVTGSQIKAYVNSGDGALASKNTVATADIDNLAVTTAKIAADAIDGTKIADDAIGNEHIATGAVNADSIASNAVGADELNVTGNGTSGQYLASDGDGTMTWTSLPAAGGGFSNMQVFTSPGTWTNPGNIEKVKVTVTGGGGGSGAPDSASNLRASGGGGGAGTAIKIVSFPNATNVAVTIGSGGTPTNSITGKANDGGTSSFGAYCSATGGGGSYSGDTPSDLLRGAGGNPGSGSGGDLNISGGNGGDVIFLGSPLPSNSNSGAYGGGTYWGPGGAGFFRGVNGSRPNAQGGLAYGSGSGGRDEGGTAGNGASGIVVVEY